MWTDRALESLNILKSDTKVTEASEPISVSRGRHRFIADLGPIRFGCVTVVIRPNRPLIRELIWLFGWKSIGILEALDARRVRTGSSSVARCSSRLRSIVAAPASATYSTDIGRSWSSVWQSRM
jgi:hypothetical protein